MKNKGGLYLMRYNTINSKEKTVIYVKNNSKEIYRIHRWGMVGFKFGRTADIEKRLKAYKKVKGIEYNLIKFFPCNNEKKREELLKSELYDENIGLGKYWYLENINSWGGFPEHISLNDTKLKYMFYLVYKYSIGKIVKLKNYVDIPAKYWYISNHKVIIARNNEKIEQMKREGLI